MPCNQFLRKLVTRTKYCYWAIVEILLGLYWTLCMIVVYQDRHISELAHPSSNNNNNNKLKLSDVSYMPWALAWGRLQIDLCPVSDRTGHKNLNNDIGLLLGIIGLVMQLQIYRDQ